MNKLNAPMRDSRPVFNMKAVAAKTGLNPATIRAWERRYGLPRPTRTAGGHRQYSRSDVDTLKWLIAQQEDGVSISHSIDLWHSYVDKGQDPLQIEATGIKKPKVRFAPAFEGGQIDQLREAWVSACLAYDRELAEQVLASAFALYDPEIVCVELLQRALVEVGNGWYNGEVTVQQEHFTSALTLQRLEMLISATPPPTRPERIMVATAPADYHIFSPLLLTFLLRRRGWDVIYLGANVPADELELAIEHIKPELFVVSAQLLHTAATLKDLATAAQVHGITLAFGGLVFNRMPVLRNLIPGHFLGESLPDAVQSVSEIMMQPQPISKWVEPSDTCQRALIQYSERRVLIESYVWRAFMSTNKPTEHLTSINSDIAQTIEAALKLGDMRLLQSDFSWIENLLMGYHLPRPLIAEYVLVYHQAAKIHLDQSAGCIVSWLSQILTGANLIERA
jgi:DNA-binding transcriptional MerR regulator